MYVQRFPVEKQAVQMNKDVCCVARTTLETGGGGGKRRRESHTIFFEKEGRRRRKEGPFCLLHPFSLPVVQYETCSRRAYPSEKYLLLA